MPFNGQGYANRSIIIIVISTITLSTNSRAANSVECSVRKRY